ncbi:elicitor-like transglutaminase, putative [Phytophthora infestans T30-4]|uniref:Elicitor-like transglutaminase, putative n=1 Tax=Phytophthora infestans (strain T30-4) TaxID=403677 RepID=D0NM49_PHYIT|nr:elicitor-like transglutaminase, putative [Phytophthora infestans T30-4]EEY60770.1 elicitor-like transglutaminase, putative [Phytophthora infestans T30-4]|eukprot:XP_002899716.1 elicitor-like transglutaminase, putative [Phytophthora infestans T30-4]
MVMIVRSVALGAAIAAASTLLIQSAPLESNPYTPVELNAPLNASHPAYGAKPNDDCAKPIIPVDPNEAHAKSMTVKNDVAYRKLRVMEDSSYSDIDDLSSYFGEQLEVGFKVLKGQFPHATAPNTPWPSSYWPTFQDSINHVWKSGEACPSEKYAKAYGLDVGDFKDKISTSNGIDSIKNAKSCRTKADCNGSGECAMRDGTSTGRCIPSWYGLCHAWAPAALLEQEPKCNVELNDVNFRVLDIKALLTEVYDGAQISTVFTGARFNGPDNAGDVDQFGRFTKPARRDLGAGFFHIAISNIMGKHQTSLIMDVAADSEVWNQPVWSYNVQTMEIVDTAKACETHFGTSSYPFNSGMVHLAYVKTTVTWAVETYIDGALVSTGKMGQFTVSNNYEYLLELDSDYNIIGVTSVGLSYADVQELLELSIACNSTSTDSEEASHSGDESTEAPLKSKDTTAGKSDKNNGKGKKEAEAPSKTPESTIEEKTDAPVFTTATPTEETYGTDAPTPAPTGTEGESEETPVPTSPEQQPSTDAPVSTTATPTEETYGTDAPTPAPTGTEGESEETPVPTSPEQQPSTEVPVSTTATPTEETRSTGCPGFYDRYPD